MRLQRRVIEQGCSLDDLVQKKGAEGRGRFDPIQREERGSPEATIGGDDGTQREQLGQSIFLFTFVMSYEYTPMIMAGEAH